MKVAIVVTILSSWATLVLSVPVEKGDQSRAERTISEEELELELEEIENRVDAVKRKVKEEAEKKQPITGIFSTPFIETTVAINVKSDKIINKPEKIEITKSSLEPTIQITRISPTPTVSKDTKAKILVEKLQAEVVVKVEKLVPPEKNEIKVEVLPSAQRKEVEENTRDTVSSVERVSESITKSKNVQPLTSESKDSVAVGKVKEKENKKETRLPIQISVERKENDEELDLAAGSTKKINNNKTVISVEKISQTEKNKEIKEKSPGHTVIVKVEKVTNEENVNGPHQITIRKVQDDDVEEQGKEREEEELEAGGMTGQLQGNKGSKKAKHVKIKEETENTGAIPNLVTKLKASEAEDESVNHEKRELLNNDKEKEDKKVVKETKENVNVAVKTVEPTQPSLNTAGKQNQDKQKAAEQEDLQVKVQRLQVEASPTKEALPAENNLKTDSAKVEKVQFAAFSDAGVDNVDSRENEENELEGEQVVLSEKETPEERRIAKEFDKALEKERSKVLKLKTEVPNTHSPIIPTTIMQSAETKEAESENQNVTPASKATSKGDISIEELELVALAEKTLNEDNKNKKKALAATQPPSSTGAKEENHSEVTVTVTKVTNKNFLSEKETAKEEKKLKDELSKEIEQERTGSPPLIEIAKTTEKPEIVATTKVAVKKEGPDINPDKDIINSETRKEDGPEHDIEGEQELKLEN